MDEFFQITHKDEKSRARLGVLKTAHGEIHTPAFVPAGLHSALRVAAAAELKFWGAEAITAEIYQLMLRPGDNIIKRSGGLHNFMGWRGTIITDSGSLSLLCPAKNHQGAKENFSPTNVTVTESGVAFQAGKDRTVRSLNPEQSVQIQANLGSDIAVSFGHQPEDQDDKARVNLSLNYTTAWMERAKRQFSKVVGDHTNPQQKQFGAISGGSLLDAWKKCAGVAATFAFDGYYFHPLPRDMSLQKSWEIFDATAGLLEEDKPRYAAQVNSLEQIADAVGSGVDLFDSMTPINAAQEGRLWVSGKTGGGYRQINIFAAIYEADHTPVDNTCNCYMCLNHTAAGVHDLFSRGEDFAVRLAVIHNIKFFLNFMEKIRRAIRYGSFAESKESFREAR